MTMVSFLFPKDRVMGPLPNGLFHGLQMGGDPNHLHIHWDVILQANPSSLKQKKLGWWVKLKSDLFLIHLPGVFLWLKGLKRTLRMGASLRQEYVNLMAKKIWETTIIPFFVVKCCSSSTSCTCYTWWVLKPRIEKPVLLRCPELEVRINRVWKSS